MNVLFVQWQEYFHSVKDGMFLSPHGNIPALALINIHYICILLNENDVLVQVCKIGFFRDLLESVVEIRFCLKTRSRII